MKRLDCILLFAAAALLMVSCVKDSTRPVHYDVPLEFNPVIYSHVKGGFSASYPEDVPFGVSAITLPLGSRWEDCSNQAQAFLSNEKVTSLSGGWFPQSGCLWPQADKSVSVVAYAPYGAAEKCSLVDGVVFSNVDMDKSQTDLLYTDPVTDMNVAGNGGPVPLPFKHALSTVNIKIKNIVGDSQRVVVKSVRLPGVKFKGNFKSLPYPVWSISSEETQLLFYNGEYETSHTPENIGTTFLVLPQQFSTAFVVDFTYYTHSGTCLNMSLSSRQISTMLEAGRNYTYTISVGIDEVKFLLEVIDSYLQ